MVAHLLYLYPVICWYICYICIQWAAATSVISVSSDLLQTSVISVSSDLHICYIWYPVICYITVISVSSVHLLYLYPVICCYICYICIQWSAATSVISVSSDLLRNLLYLDTDITAASICYICIQWSAATSVISVSSDLLHLLYLYPVIC